jgi:hypothetical protein
MKEWLLGLVVRFIVEQIRNGGIEALAEKLQAIVIPTVRKYKDEIFERLKAEAAADGDPNGLNDSVVEALDLFFDALIPNCSQCLASVSKSENQKSENLAVS